MEGGKGKYIGHWNVGYLNNWIVTVYNALSSVTYLTGYSSNLWQYGINIIIPKETGKFRVDRIRIILLYEADFIFNNKTLGTKMMKQVELDGLLALEQYGSKKKKTAIKRDLNKRLIFDIHVKLKI